ncbi:MAG: regulatory protein RecX [Patescibacteria group bacterium]
MDITESDVYERLIGSCIRFVSFRPRSGKEITDFIVRKLKTGHTTAPLVVRKVLERLTELAYVDDVAFASWWVSQRTGRKPKGARVIHQELLQKGIPPEIIDEAIRVGMKDERSELTLAKAAAEKKSGSWSKLPLPERKHKLIQYLLRRGFASGIVWSVVDEVVGNV